MNTKNFRKAWFENELCMELSLKLEQEIKTLTSL